jgi:non-heme chloroperoxidase
VAYITVGRENSTTIDLYYEDHGAGPAIVLVPCFPFGGAMWEKQVEPLVREGHRVITYDRRGFGKSSRPAGDYGFDILASDVGALLTTLDVRQATLAGASMGTGEVVRYLHSYGSTRVIRAVLISPLPPFPPKGTNPPGRAGARFEPTLVALTQDRPKFIADFITAMVSTGAGPSARISRDELRYHWTSAVSASPLAMAACLNAWPTDFREDLCAIDIPTLVISGERDQLTPYDLTAGRILDYVAHCSIVRVPDAPHGVFWTHASDVNRLLLEFVDG